MDLRGNYAKRLRVGLVLVAVTVLATASTAFALDIGGTPGDDRIRGSIGADAISAGAGDDRVRGFAGNDVVQGEAGRDRVFGNAGDDTLNGLEGTDRLYGNSGRRHSARRTGDDRIFANVGADITCGGEGDDRLWALARADVPLPVVDTLRGEGGDDRIRTRDGEADVVGCGEGVDVAVLDTVDVIEDATAENANGSCENVVRAEPRAQDARSEYAVQAPSEDTLQN